MKTAFRLASASVLLSLSLGLAINAGAQDLLKYEAECGAEGYTGNFQSMEAVDELTVKFTLCNPDPAFASKVAFSAFGVHSSEHLEATGGGGDLVTTPVGTGPYMLERWDPGNEMVFTANPDYWGTAAIEPTLIYRWNSESAARLTELQSGTVDGIDNPGQADMEVLAADANYALYERSGTNVFYVGMNNTVEPFNVKEVRQAIAIALDRQRIVDNFYPAGSITATQFMPPSIFGYIDGFEPLDAGLSPEDKLARARELLAAGGFPDGFEVTLNYRDVVRGYLPSPGIVAQDIQTQLAEIGITVNIEVMESGAFLDASSAGELSMFLLGWGADYPDATNFLDYHFGIGSDDAFGEEIPELMDILTQASRLADQQARLDLYAQAAEIIRDEVPMVPIAHGGSGAAFKASVVGAYASDIGAEQFALMEDPDDDNIIWMQNAEPISLYCADETDGETLRACEQVVESLLRYEVGTGAPIPSLASEYTSNEDATEWTFTLREGVKFHDGTTLDANDVVQSYYVQWDAASPLHVGRTGEFYYFSALFGGFLNPPPPADE